MFVEGLVGSNREGVTDGVHSILRKGKTGELITGDAHGEHYEACSRSNVFTGATATAGVAHGSLSIGTAGAAVIYNPIASGVNLSLIQASSWYVSGTLGAGLLLFVASSGIPAVTPGGTACVARRALISGGAGTPKGTMFSLASGLVGLVTLRPYCSLLAFAGAAIGSTIIIKDQLNGEFVVPPGYCFGIHGITAAGTTPIMGHSFTWEEIPIS